MKNYLSIAVVAITLASCGGSTEKTHEEKTSVVAEKTCTYSYNNETTTVNWTAYKHTAKNPVGGKFKTFETMVETASAESVVEILKTMKMSVDVSSINSKDTTRDKKLVAFFFDKMLNTSKIEGSVKSATESMGVITMKMNDVEQDVNFEYSVDENNKLKLKATIDVLKFQAEEALASLNKACEAKHTGGDGVNKLWSEVSIYITTQLDKNCK